MSAKVECPRSHVQIDPAEVHRLLTAWRGGDCGACDELITLCYGPLLRLARRQLARAPRRGAPEPAALLHEAYLRLRGQRSANWQNAEQFFAVAGRMMRRVLIDRRRRRTVAKRGGEAVDLPLDEAISVPDHSAGRVDFDDTLHDLARLEPRQRRIVEFRVVHGLTVGETAAALGISIITVARDWRAARDYLRKELGGVRAAA